MFIKSVLLKTIISFFFNRLLLYFSNSFLTNLYDLNRSSAEIARKIADDYSLKDPLKPRFVCGAIGPTNKTASISPDVSNPAFRNINFNELAEAYEKQAEGLIKFYNELNGNIASNQEDQAAEAQLAQVVFTDSEIIGKVLKMLKEHLTFLGSSTQGYFADL